MFLISSIDVRVKIYDQVWVSRILSLMEKALTSFKETRYSDYIFIGWFSEMSLSFISLIYRLEMDILWYIRLKIVSVLFFKPNTFPSCLRKTWKTSHGRIFPFLNWFLLIGDNFLLCIDDSPNIILQLCESRLLEKNDLSR